MFWYTNNFWERSEPGGGDSKHIENQWMLIAIANAESRRKHSDWREAIVSAVSAHFEQSKSIWRIFFHMGMFY